jgi:hypothetical protein
MAAHTFVFGSYVSENGVGRSLSTTLSVAFCDDGQVEACFPARAYKAVRYSMPAESARNLIDLVASESATDAKDALAIRDNINEIEISMYVTHSAVTDGGGELGTRRMRFSRATFDEGEARARLKEQLEEWFDMTRGLRVIIGETDEGDAGEEAATRPKDTDLLRDFMQATRRSANDVIMLKALHREYMVYITAASQVPKRLCAFKDELKEHHYTIVENRRNLKCSIDDGRGRAGQDGGVRGQVVWLRRRHAGPPAARAFSSMRRRISACSGVPACSTSMEPRSPVGAEPGGTAGAASARRCSDLR